MNDVELQIINTKTEQEELIESVDTTLVFDYFTFFDKFLNQYLFLLISFFIFLLFVVLIIISLVYDANEKNVNNIESAESAEDNLTFWGNLFLKYVVIIGLQFITSYFVRNYNLKVNYSRKIMHLSFFLWPQLLDNLLLTFESNIITQFWNIWVVLFTLYLLMEKIRKKLPPCEYMFAAIDRPEDRPLTLQWTLFQVFLIFCVLIPFSIFFIKSNTIPSEWVFIPILINGFSDGLAEPIGIRFGKHKYKTYALCTSKSYQRSYEGSLWVFICTVAIMAIFHHTFNTNQLIISLTAFPILITLVEAQSPHTIDAPFLYLFGYLSLYGIYFIK